MKIRHKDKIKHFLVSFIITVFVYWLAREILISIMAALVVGLGRELYDSYKIKNTFRESMADIAVNATGILFGVLIIKSI